MATDSRKVSTVLDAAVLAGDTPYDSYENVVKAENPLELPAGGQVVSVTPSGFSAFCKTYRVEVLLPGGEHSVFFQKLAKGKAGLDLMHAVWDSETAVYNAIPELTPRPYCLRTYQSDGDSHFYLTEFVDMVEDTIPMPEAYMAPVVALHRRTKDKSPNGKFGFHASTAYGNLLQNNSWESSWEVFWTRIMKEAFEVEERARGPHDQNLNSLKTAWFNNVIPRYLRPLETNGRSLTPCLVHADLWPGNCRYRQDMVSVCVYDANAFWGHGEVDLGVFRNPRYALGESYLMEYWKHIPISEPKEDALGRNDVYMVRNQVLLSALFPNDRTLREIFVNNMHSIVERLREERQRMRRH